MFSSRRSALLSTLAGVFLLLAHRLLTCEECDGTPQVQQGVLAQSKLLLRKIFGGALPPKLVVSHVTGD